jgi:hypothetical protein
MEGERAIARSGRMLVHSSSEGVVQLDLCSGRPWSGEEGKGGMGVVVHNPEINS